MKLGPGPRLAVGDSLQIFEPATGSVSYRTVVSFIQGGAGGDEDWKTIRLDQGMPGMSGDGESPTSTSIYNLNASCGGFVVRDTVIRNARGHGAVLNGAMISGAAQGGVALANIYTILPDATGPVPIYTTVRRNTIHDCGFMDPVWLGHWGASILAGAFKGAPSGTYSDYPSATNLIIEANSMDDWTRYGVFGVGLGACKIRADVGTGMANVFSGSGTGAHRSWSGTTCIRGRAFRPVDCPGRERKRNWHLLV